MRSVHAETVIHSLPEAILSSFLEPPHLQGWWGVSRSLVERKIGGLYTLAWEINELGIRYISSGIIEQIIPHDYLKISKLVYLNPERQILGPLELEVQVSRTDEFNSKVTIVQTGYQYGGDWDWYYDAVVKAWPYALGLLKKYLENNNSLKNAG